MKTSKATPTIRLNKYLANHGLAARRDIESLLKVKTVTINGKKALEPGIRLDPTKDIVMVNGEPIAMPEFVYLMVNKPTGVISTVTDERYRKTVISLVDTKERLYPVGRLDQDSSGLMLLTNDGELTNRLTHPRYHIPKTYHVIVRGEVNENKLKRFTTGITLEDGKTAPSQASVLETKGDYTTLKIILHEGRKRQIRRMCEVLHLNVIELQRVKMGPLVLGDLALGKSRKLTDEEINALKDAAFKTNN